MEWIIKQNYEQCCAYAAEQIRDTVTAKPTAKLGLATGGTPVAIYRLLAQMHQTGGLDFSQVRTINLDEYVGLSPDHPQSYRYFMNEQLFRHINIQTKHTFVPAGIGDMEQNAKAVDAATFLGGPPDLQLLGVGHNGHIGFNEPGDTLCAPAHLEALAPSTLEANARFFTDEESVPTQALTMGIQGILSARKILLVACGTSKQHAITALCENGSVTTQIPVTLLKLHTNVVVVIDQELADCLPVYPDGPGNFET